MGVIQASIDLDCRRDQAAALASVAVGPIAASMPSVNFTPWITFGNWWCPSRRRQLSSAAWASLKIIASSVLFERHPFDRPMSDDCERAFDWLGRAQVLPMLGREIVKG
jgi:hypothetical protein